MILEDIQKEKYFQDSELLNSLKQKTKLSISKKSSLIPSSSIDSKNGVLPGDPSERDIKASLQLLKRHRQTSFKFGQTFLLLLVELKNKSKANSIIFEYLYLSLRHLTLIEQSHRVEKEYHAWTDFFIKHGETLLDVDQKKMVDLVKMLPPKMVYRFIVKLPLYYSIVKLDLLQHLEALGESNLIHDKILFFELVCKFRPEKAHTFIDNLEGVYYQRCLEISEQEGNLHAQAYIQFKWGKYSESFDLYAQM